MLQRLLATGINVLVYTGNGTSPNSVKHAQKTLKQILGHAYDIIPVDARTLQSEPWEDSCSMLVMPGGRDLPYCADLNGAANTRIKNYVNGGGRYLGLCAGAYYASSCIEFEQGRPDMEVCGLRELAFFPGTCRGTMYPGFVYDSEQGARSTPVQLISEYLQPFYGNDELVPKTLPMYYNGGGYFAHAEDYENIQVLGRFIDSGICKDETNPAAAIACSVGKGTAVLIATHPEYDMESFGGDMQDLVASEPDRKLFLRAVLAKMGLDVGNKKPENDEIPALSPIYLCANNPMATRSIATELESLAKDGILKDSTNEFWLTTNDNEDIHQKLASLQLNNNNNNKDAVIPLEIRLMTSDPAWPDATVTPNFNIKRFFEELKRQREREWGGGKWYHLGNVMMYSQVITSTQTVLDKNYNFAQALPTGLVCVGTTQLAARARGRNSWVSQLGALQFSFLVRHSTRLSHAPVVFIQYLIALAVVESIRERKGYEDVPLRVKWPNDVYADINGDLKKVGGLLVNSSFVQDEFLLVIGCGINLGNPKPTVSINDVIRKHDSSLAPLSSEEALAGMLTTFERFYSQFCGKGMGPWFLDTYYKRWLHSDKIVTLTTHDNVRVKITGITHDYGMLEAVAVDGSNKRYTLQPDGNSFDMLKGLIIKKA